MKEYKRICDLGHETFYENEKFYLRALKKGKCKKCSLSKRADEQRGIKKGSSFSLFNIWKRKYGLEEALNRERERKNKLSIAQKNFLSTPEGKEVLRKSGEASKYLENTWRKKGFSEEEISIKLKEKRRKQSERQRGEGNPMFGKPAPKKSGNGWKGYYLGDFFSSLRELGYIYFLKKRGISFERCDKIKLKIPYLLDEVKRNYFPDFLVSGKYLVEIKPKRLIGTAQNKAKFLSADEYCKSKGLIFKIKSKIFLTDDKIRELYNKGDLIFTEKYEQRYLKYVSSGKTINRKDL